MARQPPQANVKIAKPSQTSSGGVLPVSTTGSKPRVTASHGSSSRSHAAGLKVNIRRLPPGLSEEEFQIAIGDEWKSGTPNVGWSYYASGKVSKDPSKPSRPSRAYLHLTDAYVKAHASEPLKDLQTKIAASSFMDAKGTHTDPILLPPWPTVIEAPYGRIPSSKIRKDNRQGTIDQDPEFIDFLQELTNPLVKPVPIDAITEKDSKPEEKIVTPLVQYLREKKANKAKENSSGGKNSKHGRQESKDPRSASLSDKKSSKGSKESSSEKKSSKGDRPSKESIKILNKASTTLAKAKTENNPTPRTEKSSLPAIAPSTSTAATPKAERKRERGSAAAAAKILQRDLGIGAGANPRRRRETSNTTATAKQDATPVNNEEAAKLNPSGPSNPSTSIAKDNSVAQTTSSEAVKSGRNMRGASTSGARNSGRNSAKTNTQPSKNAAATGKGSSISSGTTPSSNATEAFLKHANPSQGITEDLLQATFASFGIVTKVEIDKKKGFAYVDFVEPAALQAAISASPVKIAQGAVVVLERKAPAGASSRAPREGRGGKGAGAQRGRGRGGRQTTDRPASDNQSNAQTAPVDKSNNISPAAGP